MRSVLYCAHLPFADPDFIGEFLLPGGMIAPVAQFLDLLSIELNFAPHLPSEPMQLACDRNEYKECVNTCGRAADEWCERTERRTGLVRWGWRKAC